MASAEMIYLCGPRKLDSSVWLDAESVVRFEFPHARIYNPARRSGAAGLPLHGSLTPQLLLLGCDLIVLLPGWNEDGEAMLEEAYAHELDMDRLSLRWKRDSYSGVHLEVDPNPRRSK